MRESKIPRRMSYAEKGRFFKIRNILNIIFMMVAIVGVLLYFFSGHTLGTVMVLIAIVFKIVESILRFFH